MHLLSLMSKILVLRIIGLVPYPSEDHFRYNFDRENFLPIQGSRKEVRRAVDIFGW